MERTKSSGCSSGRWMVAAASSVVLGSVVWGILKRVREAAVLQAQQSCEGRLLFEASAPGKVIISGEHSVVYGFTAIVGAINRRSRVRVWDLTSRDPGTCLERTLTVQVWTQGHCIGVWSRQLSNQDSEWELREIGSDSRFLWDVRCFRKVIDVALVGVCDGMEPDQWMRLPRLVKVEVSSELPIGCGLGSSASVSTALCAALSTLWELNTKDPNVHSSSSSSSLSKQPSTMIPRKVLDVATECERVTHGGKASGIDNAIAFHGGLVEYDKQKGCSMITVLDDDNDDDNNNHPMLMKVLVIPTGVRGETKAMVERVAQLKRSYPSVIDPIMQAISEITLKIIDGFRLKLLSKMQMNGSLQTLLSMNDALLKALDLSHPMIDEIHAFVHCILIESQCHIYDDSDSMNALSNFTGLKITGAGGGGCLILPLPMSEDINVNTNDSVIEMVEGDHSTHASTNETCMNKHNEQHSDFKLNSLLIDKIKQKYPDSFTAVIGAEKGCEIVFKS